MGKKGDLSDFERGMVVVFGDEFLAQGLHLKSHQSRGLHGLKTEARTRPVPEIVWPDPTRPEQHS